MGGFAPFIFGDFNFKWDFFGGVSKELDVFQATYKFRNFI